MAYQNINQYNFNKLYLKPVNEISDISLTSDESSYDEEVIFSDFLIAEFDGNRMPLKFDFNSSDTTICLNCGDFDVDTVVSENYWNPKGLDLEFCTETTELCDVGLTGIDNGLVMNITGETIEINKGLYIDDADKFSRYKYDARFKMHPITGFTTESNRIYNDNSYTYDLSYETDGGDIGYFTRLNGGFYQGFYKLQGYDYEVLPERYSWGWSAEFLIRQRRFADFNVGLNARYPENAGTFFYMGARAENKFYHFTDGHPLSFSGYNRVTEGDGFIKTCECEFSATSATTSCMTVYPQSAVTSTNCSCGCPCDCVKTTIKGELDPLYDGVSNALSLRLSGESNPRLCVKTYRITGGCETTGSCETTGITYTTGTSVTEWCSTRGIFDECKDTSYIDGENWVQIDAVFVRDIYLEVCDLQYKGGLKEIVKSQYIDSLNDNSIALVTPPYTHESVYNPPKKDVVSINEHWINEKNYRKGKLKFYVNGKLFFVVNDFEEIIPRPLNVEKEKQIGVSYNISVGGGTQGLHDNLTFQPVPVCDISYGVTIDLNLTAVITSGSINILYTLTSSAPISQNIEFSFAHLLGKVSGGYFVINETIIIESGQTQGELTVILDESVSELNGESVFEDFSSSGTSSINNFDITTEVIFPTPTPTPTQTVTLTPTITVTPTNPCVEYLTDELGNLLTSENGDYLISERNPCITPTPTKTSTPTPTPTITPTNPCVEYLTDELGNLLISENGDYLISERNPCVTPTMTPTNTETPTLTPTPSVTPLPAFISVWRTTTPSESITLALVPAGNYNFVVNWGDGNIETITSYSNNSHTYLTSGDYTITITGTIEGWSFNGGGSSKIIEILQWGSLQISNNGFVFAGCTNLVLTNVFDTPNLSGVTSLRYMFDSCPLITTINNIESWDVSNIIDMQSMFNISPFNQDISSWDVSNVTNMDYLFTNSSNFNQDLSGWCVPNIPIEPTSFASGASAWVLPKPIWGTCPQPLTPTPTPTPTITQTPTQTPTPTIPVICDSFTFNSINANTTINSAIKTTGGGWNSSAYSVETYTNPVSVTFNMSNSKIGAMGGFSVNPTLSESTYENATFGLYSENVNLKIYENGNNVYTVFEGGNITPSDLFKVEYDGTVVKYYYNGSLVYTSLQSITQPLHIFFPLLTENEGVINVCVIETPLPTPTPTNTETPTPTPTETPTPTPTITPNCVRQIVVPTLWNGATSINSNTLQLTRTSETLQIQVNDIITDNIGATSFVGIVSSDVNYTYVFTGPGGGLSFNCQFPLTFSGAC